MNKVVYQILFSFLFCHQTGFSQSDTILYYDLKGNNVCCKDSSISYSRITYDSIRKKYYYRNFLSMDISHGSFIEAGELSSINPLVKDGDSHFYDVLGNEIHMTYNNNNFIELSQCFDKHHNPIEKLYTFDIVDSVPKFNDIYVDSIEAFYAISDYIKSNLDSLIIKEETKNYLFYSARVIIEENGRISNISIHKLRGPKLQYETSIKKQIENLLIQTIFKPAIFKQNNVRVSGELFLKIDVY